jgi:hypothetical protein
MKVETKTMMKLKLKREAKKMSAYILNHTNPRFLSA